MDPSDHDSDLVRAARDGDKAAFGALVARHRPLLLAVCRRALADPDLADDVAQDAIVHALLSLDRLQRPERFGPWLAGIGLNLCHRLRQRARADWSWEAMLGGRTLPELVDSAPSVEEQAESAELRHWVRAAVAGLPAGQRAAVTLHYLAGLTQAETAAVLGIAPGAVKTRLFKARANLRRSLWRDLEPVAQPGRRRAMVAMRVVDVGRRRVPDDDTARHFVVLDELDGSRRLLIWIGAYEATTLALQLEGVPFVRPMTYGLMAGLVGAGGGRVRDVRIDRLEDDVFYAVIALDGPAGPTELDARPSDALNLALVLSAPIQVAEAVLAAAGSERGDEPAAPDGEIEWRAAIVADIEKAWPTRPEPAAEPSSPDAG